MTIAELQQSITKWNLFVEAAEKEAGDVGDATEGVNATATALKAGIDALVAEVVG